MHTRPVLHAAALAATLLFAGAASAQQVINPGMPGSGDTSGGKATPEMKAKVQEKAESMKQSIERGTHKLHMKMKGEDHAQSSDTSSRHNRRESSRMNAAENSGSSGSGMNSASFRREMAKCTSNEDMTARANCAREAVAAHGGSSAS